MSDVVAILCSDMHLSHRAPASRVDDWYTAMGRMLLQLRMIQEEYEAPIVCAGDIFDRWNSPPELINFAIMHVPKMYAIPGQHDLPNHNIDEIGRSAYWTLDEAGIIQTIGYNTPVRVGKLILHAFPWGQPLKPYPPGEADGWLHLAVVHQYVWTKKTGGYPGADPDARIDRMGDVLRGYHAAVFGDNHTPFRAFVGDCNVINTGTMLRRKIDEQKHTPGVGLLCENGEIELMFFDVRKDEFVEVTDLPEAPELDANDFIADLRDLSADSLDFRETVRRHLNETDATPEVRKLVQDAMG